ncbi:MAG: NUDIX domain-containing protein [Acidobacteriota bacterium]
MSESKPAHSWIVELRHRLSTPPPARLKPEEVRRAAILIPLYVDAGELWTVLTKRAESLPHHKSQIAFPGGGLEIGEDHWTGALREAEEEIGIDPGTVMRIGELDEAATPSDRTSRSESHDETRLRVERARVTSRSAMVG